MSRFRLLFLSTAVRLSALFILLFALAAGALVLYVTAMSERLLITEIRESLNQEVSAIERAYERGGIGQLARVMDIRARQPGANLYIIAGPAGEVLAGNVASVPPGIFDREGWTAEPFAYRRYQEEARQHPPRVAIARIVFLDNGMRILVGRDLAEPGALRLLVRRAIFVTVGVMGVGALILWFFIGRNALRRIDRISDASKKIMAGDLAQRLPVSGSGDEFDRLSLSLNEMLERIGRLNEGLRQVSDNIAHDLKTPLTRLKNRANEALAAGDEEARRQSLEGIQAEADQIIRTFDSLLMISRVEAGSQAASLTDLDLSAIAADCVELYEPVAEEAGFRLEAQIAPGIGIKGNRELIGQTLANLIDNAIKYGDGEGIERLIRVSLAHDGGGVALSVSDRGRGIPADRRADVMKRFVRLDESRSKPGTGLGLAMAEAVMMLHGGTITLADTDPTSPDHPGLTVTLRF
ncbi:sensor histidine kinase [Gellertiella hungarica]|uniref:histidine kinase n=1 Tax=Gellertiella hungarica TaxID=1572859 RepID=A0A7W6J871_9HYPH|nr:HAMP domain-containing sensor histidine kinase [Gellertiella hungarica]MBB4065706.1 signal transduction histidine kinase [Gellertiella hungarica]